MGYFSNLQLDILETAQNLGDPRGDDAETILTISRIFGEPAEVVQEVLTAEYDADYAERSADLDAEYYGA